MNVFYRDRADSSHDDWSIERVAKTGVVEWKRHLLKSDRFVLTLLVRSRKYSREICLEERYHEIHRIERREKDLMYECRRVAAFIEECHRTERNYHIPPCQPI